MRIDDANARRRRGGRIGRLLAGAMVLALASPASAQTVSQIDQLLALDLTALLRVRVTLPSRVAEEAFAVPAAVFVIGADEIRRSGHRRLADVLRLVPGLHVGQIDSGKRVVSARNGMLRFSSTMLVMVDGRHVYTPLYGGVRWEQLDLPLETIERIEIVRGPGGALWGANAVDGIVHVITRPAAADDGTQGALALGSGELRGDAVLARSGRLGAGTQWRLQLRGYESDRGSHLPAAQSTHRDRRVPGSEAGDGGRAIHAGLRSDTRLGDGHTLATHWALSHQGIDEERALARGVLPNHISAGQASAGADWQRTLAGGGALRLQAGLSHRRTADDILDERETLLDADLQHTAPAFGGALAWGLGARHYRSASTLPAARPCVACFTLLPEVATDTTVHGFVQQQQPLSEMLRLTLGSKFERSRRGGFHVQPTLRLAWTPVADQLLWAALTSPVRNPTRTERDQAFVDVAPADVALFGCRSVVQGVCAVGNAQAPYWRVRSAEAGWRLRAGVTWGVDLALFDNRYDMRNAAGSAATAVSGSRLHGAELTLRWNPLPQLRLAADLTRHRGSERTLAGLRRPVTLLPEDRAHVGVRWQPAGHWRLDADLYTASAMSRPAGAATITLPRQRRLDLRAAWRAAPATELALGVTNARGDGGAEAVELNKVNTAPRRATLLTLTHGF